MDISVIICTYNRAESLKLCFDYLQQQQIPDGIEWEIVLVDNNSADHTLQVVESYRPRLPLRFVKETNQGLSFARNRGFHDSQGEIVVYIDDDILTEPGWLTALWSVFIETGCDSAGGCIHLETNGRVFPQWLGPILWGYLGHIDHGKDRVALDGRKSYPHGGNMAFSRDLIDRMGLFDVRLGRTGNKIAKGEETEYFRRISSEGARIMYEPAARVRHIIKPEELSKRHFRRLQMRGGEYEAMVENTVFPRSVCGVPLFLGTEFFKAVKEYFWILPATAEMRFRKEMALWRMLGYALTRFRRYRNNELRAE